MIDLAIFKRIPPNSTPEYAEQHHAEAEEIARNVEAYWTYYGVDCTANGYVFEGDDKTARTSRNEFAQTAVKKFKKDNGIECDYHLIIGGSPRAGEKRCGEGQTPGKWATCFSTFGCSDHCYVHELGHAMFGFLHSGREPGTSAGDDTCIMGAGTKMVGLCAPRLYAMGMCRGMFAFHSDGGESLTIKLMPLELREVDLLEDHYRCVIIKDHFLSIRKSRGAPFPCRNESTLYIHRLEKNGQTYRLKDMKPGDTFELPNGVIKYVSYDDEIATVEVKL